VLSLRALQRVEEVWQAADGDGTETGFEVCFACEPDRRDYYHLRLEVERERVRRGEKSKGRTGIPRPTWPAKFDDIEREGFVESLN